jgi:hypothetical protein
MLHVCIYSEQSWTSWATHLHAACRSIVHYSPVLCNTVRAWHIMCQPCHLRFTRVLTAPVAPLAPSRSFLQLTPAFLCVCLPPCPYPPTGPG